MDINLLVFKINDVEHDTLFKNSFLTCQQAKHLSYASTSTGNLNFKGLGIDFFKGSFL